MPKVFARESYLARLRPFYDSDIIKVITGIRRCGKSFLMLSVIEELRERGVQDENIVYLNLDRREFRKVQNSDDLDAEIERRMPANGMCYLLIDEVQNVDGWEVVINGWREERDISIFITGSNSYLLSGELVTKLTGRYVEFEMYTLDYSEWLGMRRYLGLPDPPTQRAGLEEYLTYGGFPKTLEFDDEEAKQAYVRDVIDQVIMRDIKRRVKIRNTDVFMRVLTYVTNNFGSPTNATNIAEYFNNAEKLSLRPETVRRYLEVMEEAKIICKCTRFDLKTKRSLRAQEKYYLADIGIYNARNTDNRINYGPALENMLYTYLRAQGYQVSVGKIGKLECDFICRKSREYAYVQVAYTIADRRVEEREYRPFEHIRDSFPCYLFTLDELLQHRDGVHHLNMLDFMDARGSLTEGRNGQTTEWSATGQEGTKDENKVSEGGENFKNEDFHRLNRHPHGAKEDKTAGNGEAINNQRDTLNESDETISVMSLDPDDKAVLRHLASNPHSTYEDISHETGFSRSKVSRLVRRLRDNGVLERVGSRKTGFWEITTSPD